MYKSKVGLQKPKMVSQARILFVIVFLPNCQNLVNTSRLYDTHGGAFHVMSLLWLTLTYEPDHWSTQKEYVLCTHRGSISCNLPPQLVICRSVKENKKNHLIELKCG